MTERDSGAGPEPSTPDGSDPAVPDDLSGLEELMESETKEYGASEAPGERASDEAVSVEDLVSSLETVSGERDRYLDSLRRVQAEFENYKKAISKRTADERERANDKILGDLLPVLDACEGAVKSGSDDVAPVHKQLIAALERHGLERSDPTDAPFDPELHEAVMHEPSDDVDEPTIAEVLRTGYLWKGRVIRPAMVRVKG